MRRTVTMVAVVLVVAACTNGGDDELADLVEEPDPPLDATDDPEPDPEPDPDPEPEPDPEPDEVAEFGVPDDPDDIDAAYIEAVLDRMHAGLVPALRDAVAGDEVTDELEAAIADVYNEDLVELELEGWEIGIRAELDGEELVPLVPDLEGRTHRMRQPFLLSDECIIAQVEVDIGPWHAREDLETANHAIVLVAADPAPEVNPTPWRLAVDFEPSEGDVPDWAFELCE